MTRMTAVTIAVGQQWHELGQKTALLAARCTGLPVEILGEDAVRKTGLAPSELKFRLFDLVQSENILYFDADLLFVRRWNPLLYADRRELVCVRDHWYQPHIIADARQFGVPPEDYFNSGLFIANRSHHHQWLQFAEASRYETTTKMQDQGPLNAARVRLEIPAHFLSRRYNTVGSAAAPMWDQVQAIGLHYAGGDTKELDAIASHALSISEPLSAPDEVDTAQPPKWFWCRIGEGQLRLLSLRPDGTVGAGTTAAARLWFMVGDNGNARKLFLTQPSTISHELTCCERIWHGRAATNALEQITLEPVEGEHLANLIQLQVRQARRGIVIGQPDALTCAVLLSTFPTLDLYMIVEGGTAMQRADSKIDILQATHEWRSRRFIVDAPTSQSALSIVPGDSSDFVLFTSSARASATFIYNWLGKLREGGLVVFQVTSDRSLASILEQLARSMQSVINPQDGFCWFSVPTVQLHACATSPASSNPLLAPVVRQALDSDAPINDSMRLNRNGPPQASAECEVARMIVMQRHFQYRRIGYDTRAMEFLEDGLIGQGRAGCEDCWYVRTRYDGRITLNLFGRGRVTCRLARGRDGIWRGRWLIGECMPVELVPVRSLDCG